MTDSLSIPAHLIEQTEDGCILWVGPTTIDGRPIWRHKRLQRQIARAPRGQSVYTTCGYKTCLRHDHLKLETAGKRGGPRRALSEESVTQILEDYFQGEATPESLAMEHQVGRIAIWKILAGQTWRRVSEPWLSSRGHEYATTTQPGLSAKEAAVILGVDDTTIGKWSRQGRLPFFLHRGRRRYLERDIEALRPPGFSTKEVASRIGVSVGTVQTWARTGRISFVLHDGQRRFSQEDIEAARRDYILRKPAWQRPAVWTA